MSAFNDFRFFSFRVSIQFRFRIRFSLRGVADRHDRRQPELHGQDTLQGLQELLCQRFVSWGVGGSFRVQVGHRYGPAAPSSSRYTQLPAPATPVAAAEFTTTTGQLVFHLLQSRPCRSRIPPACLLSHQHRSERKGSFQSCRATQRSTGPRFLRQRTEDREQDGSRKHCKYSEQQLHQLHFLHLLKSDEGQFEGGRGLAPQPVLPPHPHKDAGVEEGLHREGKSQLCLSAVCGSPAIHGLPYRVRSSLFNSLPPSFAIAASKIVVFLGGKKSSICFLLSFLFLFSILLVFRFFFSLIAF